MIEKTNHKISKPGNITDLFNFCLIPDLPFFHFHSHFGKVLSASQKSCFHEYVNYVSFQLVGMTIFCIHLIVEIVRYTIK